MYSPVKSTKLWSILGTLVVILWLTGCAEQLPKASPPPDTAVYHYVDPGDTLESIASRYGRTPDEIAKWNNLVPPYKLQTHDKLIVSGPLDGTTAAVSPIPDYNSSVKRRTISTPKKKTPKPKNNNSNKNATPKPTPKTAQPASTGSKSYHQVQAGETVYSIAKRYGQDYHDIVAWNKLSPRYDLAIGQRLAVTGPRRQTKPADSTTSQAGKTTATQKYVVQPGDTLYSVAKRFGYSMSDIMAWNDLSSQELPLGKTLKVTPPKISSFQPTETTPTGKDYHTVAAGDTVYSLSQRYGCSVEQLTQWNHLPPTHQLSIGQRLRVSATTSNPKKVSQGGKNTTKCHIVKAGETLYSISKQYGYEVATVAKWNEIPSPYTVKVGRNLRLSATGCR